MAKLTREADKLHADLDRVLNEAQNAESGTAAEGPDSRVLAEAKHLRRINQAMSRTLEDYKAADFMGSRRFKVRLNAVR